MVYLLITTILKIHFTCWVIIFTIATPQRAKLFVQSSRQMMKLECKCPAHFHSWLIRKTRFRRCQTHNHYQFLFANVHRSLKRDVYEKNTWYQQTVWLNLFLSYFMATQHSQSNLCTTPHECRIQVQCHNFSLQRMSLRWCRKRNHCRRLWLAVGRHCLHRTCPFLSHSHLDFWLPRILETCKWDLNHFCMERYRERLFEEYLRGCPCTIGSLKLKNWSLENNGKFRCVFTPSSCNRFLSLKVYI